MVAVLDKPQVVPAQGARYGSALTCAAAGIDRKTINNWLSRTPAVILLSDAERREAGERNRFSFDLRRVIQIALTAELVRLDVPPRRAALCAAAFTDMAQGAGAHPRFGDRLPGELFKGAYTFLVVPPGEGSAKVVPVTHETTVIELMDPEYAPSFGSAVVVRVNDIVDRVRSALSNGGQDD